MGLRIFALRPARAGGAGGGGAVSGRPGIPVLSVGVQLREHTRQPRETPGDAASAPLEYLSGEVSCATTSAASLRVPVRPVLPPEAGSRPHTFPRSPLLPEGRPATAVCV